MSDTLQNSGDGLAQIKQYFEHRVFEYHSDLHEALYLKSTGMKMHEEINKLFAELEQLIQVREREAEKRGHDSARHTKA